MSRGFKLGVELDGGFKSKFLSNVKKEIHRKISKGGNAAAVRIANRLRQSMVMRITSSTEYIELSQSKFRGELGIPNIGDRLDAVIQQWADSISVIFQTSTMAGTLGQIKIGLIAENYEDVLSLPEASFNYTSRKGQKTLEWLRWLLLEGSQVIVSDHQYIEDSRRGRSRTGLGIMIKRRGGWKIPVQLAGTDGDNFATRALEGIQGDIDTIIRQELTKVL